MTIVANTTETLMMKSAINISIRVKALQAFAPPALGEHER
jgi:hypothetical protein